jgi:hypothetical protein
MKNKKPLTGVSRITDHIVSKIIALDCNVYVSRSSRSKSRYLEVELNQKKKILVRVSDHPADPIRRRRYRFDIYTGQPRPGAISYQQFDEAIKDICGRKT